MLSQLKKTDSLFEINDNKSNEENDIKKMYHGINAISKARQEQVNNLSLQLKQSKMFLNMVIHDMRNPTVSIKLGLQMSISALRSIGLIFKD